MTPTALPVSPHKSCQKNPPHPARLTDIPPDVKVPRVAPKIGHNIPDTVVQSKMRLLYFITAHLIKSPQTVRTFFTLTVINIGLPYPHSILGQLIFFNGNANLCMYPVTFPIVCFDLQFNSDLIILCSFIRNFGYPFQIYAILTFDQ